MNRGFSISLDRVSRVFGEATSPIIAVNDVSLEFRAGSFNSFVGPSGCGKSTLLRIIAGLDVPTSGRCELRSESEGDRPRLAYVFQDAHLLPWRSVMGNVELPLQLQGMSRGRRRARAADAIARVGLTDASRRYPAQLSGGMRMRVSLARALVSQPDVLLLDEPFAALDEITRQELDDELLAIWRAGSGGAAMTVVFVTHSIAEAAYLSERVVVFSARPARITLDRVLDLPEVRSAELRTEAPFARESRLLFDALRASTKSVEVSSFK